MKKTILLCSAFLPIISFAQNVNIPDANFKAYLLSNSSINTNSDSEIQLSEAQAFTGTIFASNLGINDLTGIESFISLTGLLCAGNNLTSLDVSSNIALTDLRCADNALGNLNVSANTALQILNCWNCQLTSLDLSTNTLLNSLNFGQNNLTSIALINNHLLATLNAGFNDLISLNLSNLTVLEYLYCTDNLLTSLDISNGNNTSILEIHVENNNNLDCIEVDNISYSISNWTSPEFTFDAGINFSTDCASFLNITKESIPEFEIFPNPSNSQITITNKKATNYSLINLTGEIILTTETNTHHTIDISELSNGMYFIRDENSGTIQKLIKE